MCVFLYYVQVCIPFLLFCLGVDPKLDLNKLPSVLSELGLSWNQPSHNRTSGDHPASKPQVTQDKENVPTAITRPTGQLKAQSGQGFESSSRAGRLLTLLSSLSPAKKPERYQGTPRLPLVLSGCHALLLFLGCDEKLPGSILDSGMHVQCTIHIHNLRCWGQC